MSICCILSEMLRSVSGNQIEEHEAVTVSRAGKIAPSTTLWNDPHLGTVCAHHCRKAQNTSELD